MTMTAELLKTPLYDWHVAHGGRMVEFGGWSMPVQYRSIVDEHQATRTAAGVFDISHMGRLHFFGPAAAEFLDTIVTRRVTDMKVGQIRYALACNDQGGILDDVLVYRTAESAATEDESPTFQMVVNASNRAKIASWIAGRVPDFAVRMSDVTTQTAMIAVQGPRAVALVDARWQGDLSATRYYWGSRGTLAGKECFVSRTGYTGEDGCEIICAATDAGRLWEQTIAAAQDVGGQPVGLGARDTLRLEAAMPLFGHELSESINPLQAGLDFAVNLEGREFIGREALVRFAADKSQPVRVGLQLDGKRVPREGYPVLQGHERVGEVTSGTFSPTFERPIAMAYVRTSAQAVGTRLAVDIRGTQHPAVVVPLPFYKRQE
jgi:aminomethyltransferase